MKNHNIQPPIALITSPSTATYSGHTHDFSKTGAANAVRARPVQEANIKRPGDLNGKSGGWHSMWKWNGKSGCWEP